MATTTLPAPSTASAANPVRNVRVLVRENWTDAWTVADYLQPIAAELLAAPSVDTADFAFHFGRIKREDASAVAVEEPADLRRWFVRIELLPPATPAAAGFASLGSPAAVPLWTGILVEEGVAEMKPASSGDRQGTQTLRAYGLEWLFERHPLVGAVYLPRGTAASAYIDHPLVANQVSPNGPQQGNRSAIQYTDAVTGLASYVFTADTDSGDGGETWSIVDIIEELTNSHPPGKPNDIIPVYVAGAHAALEQIPLGIWERDGLNLLEAINQLVDRRRGFAWCIRFDGADNLYLVIYTLTDTAVTLGTTTIPANTEPVTIDLDDASTSGGGLNGCEIRVDATQQQADTIIVRGARIKATFSVGMGATSSFYSWSGTLEPTWSTAEENAYKAADDDERATDKHAHVYTTFRIPPTWNLRVIAAQPLFHVNPQLTDQGYLDLTGAQATQPGFGHVLLKQTTIAREDDQANPAEYLAPMAFVQDAAGDWHHVETLEDHPADVRPLDGAFGIEIKPKTNHAFALNHWGTGAAASDTEPVYDYETLVCTVTMELYTRLQVVEFLDASVIAADNYGTTVVIDVPDAEFWWHARGTVTGITDGQPVIFDPYYAGSALPMADQVIRDDSERLRGIAAAARTWYGRPRNAMTLTFGRLVADYTVGQLLTPTTGATAPLGLGVPPSTAPATGTGGAPITRVRWEFDSQTTVVETAFAELDWRLG